MDAGTSAAYDSCLSYSPSPAAGVPWRHPPYLGQAGELCRASELKVEVTCAAGAVKKTLAAVKAVHPYEEPVINVIPLLDTGL